MPALKATLEDPVSLAEVLRGNPADVEKQREEVLNRYRVLHYIETRLKANYPIYPLDSLKGKKLTVNDNEVVETEVEGIRKVFERMKISPTKGGGFVDLDGDKKAHLRLYGTCDHVYALKNGVRSPTRTKGLAHGGKYSKEPMQLKSLEKIDQLLTRGAGKTLIVSGYGLGKTAFCKQVFLKWLEKKEGKYELAICRKCSPLVSIYKRAPARVRARARSQKIGG